jgi:hypothetical protein
VVEELIESIGIMVGANSVESTAACKEQQNMNNGYLDSGFIFLPASVSSSFNILSPWECQEAIYIS